MIGALVGVIVAIFGVIGAVLFWPIRALLRKRKAAAGGADSASEAGEHDVAVAVAAGAEGEPAPSADAAVEGKADLER